VAVVVGVVVLVGVLSGLDLRSLMSGTRSAERVVDLGHYCRLSSLFD
jgi:hypothetical protein